MKKALRNEVFTILDAMPDGELFTAEDILNKCRNRNSSTGSVSYYIRQYPGAVNLGQRHDHRYWMIQ